MDPWILALSLATYDQGFESNVSEGEMAVNEV